MEGEGKRVRAGDAPDQAALDVVTAAVWAYIYGYLRVLVSGPPLPERLKQLSAGGQLDSCKQLLLLCPRDGQLPEDADRLDGGRLKSVGRATVFSESVAGARSRQYGTHPVYKVSRRCPTESAEASEVRLVAAEAVSSLRTLDVVAKAMADCPRPLPPLDARQLVGQFVTRLRDAVARDSRLRDAFRVVEYDPSDQGSLEAALTAAAFGDASHEKPSVPVSPSPAAPLPGGVGVYLAWSFLHGYLAMTAGRRDVAGELASLRSDAALPLPLLRIVVLCPTTDDWSDDISSLDSQLKPVRDVDGVEAGVPALAGRSYGSFSIYRSQQEGGSCFALELATPLRTLRLGVASEKLGQHVYQREAASFTEELQMLLKENPAVAAHYMVLRVDADTRLHQELAKLANRKG